MSGCDKLVYHNVTRKVVDCLIKKAKKQGIDPKLPEDDIDKNGFKAHYKWDEQSLTLTVWIKDKPLVVTCGMIKEALDKEVRDCGGD